MTDIMSTVDGEFKEKKKKKKKDKERSMEISKSEVETSMDVSENDVSVTKKEKKKKKKDKDKDVVDEVKVKVEVGEVEVKREAPPYEELIQNISPISSPLASEKLMKRIYKCVAKAKEKKKMLRRGVGEVQKALRREETGIVILAGDTYPIDVYSHLPVLCEKKNVEYVYVPSKMGLGTALGTRRPSCVLMIKLDTEYEDLYRKIEREIKTLPVLGMIK